MGQAKHHLMVVLLSSLLFCSCLLSFSGIAYGYIIVTNPSGGTYYGGNTLTITWSDLNAGTYVRIELYRSDQFVTTIISSTYNDGSFYWSIPQSMSSSSSYKVKVTSAFNTSIYDYSSSFSIYQKNITVIKPESNAVWYTRESNEITWTSDHISNYVRISLNNGYYDQTIVYRTANDGSYNWAIPSSINPGQYRIHIRDYSDSSTYDYSPYFTIDERYINVVSPRAKSVWFAGGSHTIEWNEKNTGDYVQIELYSSGYKQSTITTSTPNDGTYTWDIPLSLQDDTITYSLRVSSVMHPQVYGSSSSFTIQPRSISIQKPQVQTTWTKGEQVDIQWISDNAGSFVDIELYEEGTLVRPIVLSTPNNGQYEWTVPESLNASGLYSIKITSTEYPEVYAYSSGYLTVENTVFQQWSSVVYALIAGIAAVIIIIVSYYVIRTKILPQQKQTTEEPREKPSMQTTKLEPLSDDEYESIWES